MREGLSVHTLHGTVHLVVALLAFVSMAIAARLLAHSLAETPRWEHLGTRIMPFATLVVGTFVLLLIGARVPRIVGLTERLFLPTALLWMLEVALALRTSLAGTLG